MAKAKKAKKTSKKKTLKKTAKKSAKSKTAAKKAKARSQKTLWFWEKQFPFGKQKITGLEIGSAIIKPVYLFPMSQ